MKRVAGRKRVRSYTPEYRAEILRLIRDEKRSVTELAREHGISRVAIYKWLADAELEAQGRLDPAPKAGTVTKSAADARSTSEKDELQRLRREVRRLEMEKEILKKAAVFFAKETS